MYLTKYPKYFNKLALDIGKARSIISSQIYKNGTDKYRGNKEEEISTLGVLGELIVRHFFEENKIKNIFNPIIDIKPIQDCDVITEQGRYDIKALKDTNQYFLVNEAAHNNKKKRELITHYLFVIIKTNNEANIISFSKKEVDGWDIVESRYTKVYRKKRI